MKSFKQLTIFVATSMLLGAVIIGCRTTKTDPGTTSDIGDGRDAAIKEIASVEGIDEGNATILYGAGFTFPGSLGDATATVIIVQTDGKVKVDVADSIVAAVQVEVAKRKEAARKEDERLKKEAIKAFKDAGISEGNATRVFGDNKNGFQSLDALDRASPKELIKAGLTDKAGAEALQKAVDKVVGDRGRTEASKLEEKLARAITDRDEAKIKAATAKAASDAAKAKATELKKASGTAQQEAEAAQAAAAKARAAAPKKAEDPATANDLLPKEKPDNE